MGLGYPEPEHPSLGLLQNTEGEGPRPGSWELSRGGLLWQSRQIQALRLKTAEKLKCVLEGGSWYLVGAQRPVMCVPYGHPVVCPLPADIL